MACCFEDDLRRRDPLIDGQRAHHLCFLEAVDKAGRKHHDVGVAGLVEIHGLFQPLLVTATGLARFTDATGKDDDRVGRHRRCRLPERFANPPHQVGLENEQIDGGHHQDDSCRVAASTPIDAAQRRVPALMARGARLQSGLNQGVHRRDTATPAVFLRHADAMRNRLGRTLGDGQSNSGLEPTCVGGDVHDAAVRGVETANLRQIGGHDGFAHDQVLVQFCRIDVRCVLGKLYGTKPTSKALMYAGTKGCGR